MRKLLAALVLCSGLAFAQSQQAEQQQQEKAEAQKKAEQRQQEQGRRISTGIEATEVGPAIGEAVGLGDEEQKGTFNMKQAYDFRGTFKDSSPGGVTLSRQGLPDAAMDVRKETRVLLDGKRVEVDDIPEGAPVRAKFQLDGGEAVLLELRATSPKQAPGKQPRQQPKQQEPAGGSGFEGEVQEGIREGAQEVEEGAREVQEDVQQ
jgi:hypothetical protein